MRRLNDTLATLQWLDEDKDGVRWNSDVDRPWEWWKHDDEDEEDEDTPEVLEARRKLKEKFRKQKKKKASGKKN